MARILVVDDEKSIRITIQAFLEDDGHEVHVAEDALTAMEILKKEDFDVVVTDIIMPKMSGVKLLKKIHEVSTNIQVILVTGEPTIETASEALRLGAFDYLAKPVTKEAIVKAAANAATTKALIDDKLRLEIENRNYQNNLEQLVEERTRELKAASELNDNIVNSSPIGISIYDPSGKCITANDAFANMIGGSKEEVLKQNYHHVETWKKSGLYDVVLSAIEANVKKCHEIKLKTTFGVEGAFDCHLVPINISGRVHLLLMARDITERKEAEEALKENEERLRSFVETAVDSIISCDSEGKIVFLNSATEEMFAYSHDELIGEPIKMLIPERLREAHKEGLDRVVSGGEAKVIRSTVELIGLKKDSSEFPIDLSLSKWQTEEGVFFTGIIHDITDKKKLEEQYLRAQRFESIGTLASGIAHDLNNILAPILIASDILRLEVQDESGREVLDMLQSSAQRGSKLVRQVTSFASGSGEEFVNFQVQHLLKEIVSIAKETFPKSIDIKLYYPKDIYLIKGIPTQIHQVLLNLCVNARDAMPAGGSLTITSSNVELSQEYARKFPEAGAGSYIVIDISDSGTGIPGELKEKVFEPFFTTKEAGKGTGLGLSTSMAIIANHNGFIDLYSEPGQGSSFKIFLPASKFSEARDSYHADSEQKQGNGELILVVDDEENFRELVSITLNNNGYRVIIARDGVEAIAVYAEHQKEVEAVILDMMMPHMDGWTAIPILQKLNPDVKIIASSGLMEMKNRITENLISGIVKAFLQKPIETYQLLSILQHVLMDEE